MGKSGRRDEGSHSDALRRADSSIPPHLPTSPRLENAPNLNRFWADLLVEELVRGGAAMFFLAPGSRSTPLVTAVAAHPTARYRVHVDERGSAFAALGWARATGQPAVWITTSGTAVANGLPAVVEASVDGVPLIALTADRPPELRDTGANQTIPQPDLFAPYVRWRTDLPAPSADVDPAFVLTTAAHALFRARSGPVHLNAMFREPLGPEPDGVALPDLPARWPDGDASFTRHAPDFGPSPEALRGTAERLARVRRGVIVAGRLAAPEAADAAHVLAETLGWPLLPDIESGLRTGPDAPAPFYDLALASEAFREAARPEVVVYLGRRATSKRLAQWLAASDATQIVVRPGPERFDPDHRVAERHVAEPGAWCRALTAALPAVREADPSYRALWQTASDAVGHTLADRLYRLTEPLAARLTVASVKPGEGLVLAASMPIRDADMFAAPGGAVVRTVANRGASGIDGTVATAAGFADGLGAPVTLLLGDLALLHDLNSLMLLRDGLDGSRPPVSVVVVNNDGGGIFHFLPIARQAEAAVFEPLFGTPHGLTFEAAARLFGLPYHAPTTPEALTEALAAPGPKLVEVCTERVANRALHAELVAACTAAVDAAIPELP